MIHGLTDTMALRLPRIAKIRLGVKKQSQSGKDYPSDTDHFVLSDCPEVAKVYGDAPKELVAVFPSDDIEIIFPTRREAWRATPSKNYLFCSSNGDEADRVYVGDKDPQGHAAVMAMPADERPDPGARFKLDCPNEECPFAERRECKPVGRLNFLLPAVTWAGTYQIETSSINGFSNILSRIAWMRAIYGGHIAFRPFYLRRVQKTVQPPDGKAQVKWILDLAIPTTPITGLTLPPALTEAPLLSIETRAERPEDLFPAERTRALPAAPGDDDPPAAENDGAIDDPALLEAIREHGISEGMVSAYLLRAGGDQEAAARLIVLDAKTRAPQGSRGRAATRSTPAARAAKADAVGQGEPIPPPDDDDAPFGAAAQAPAREAGARSGVPLAGATAPPRTSTPNGAQKGLFA